MIMKKPEFLWVCAVAEDGGTMNILWVCDDEQFARAKFWDSCDNVKRIGQRIDEYIDQPSVCAFAASDNWGRSWWYQIQRVPVLDTKRYY